jgi:lipoprotein-anchoring transpeptidase ErfK/SrfK
VDKLGVMELPPAAKDLAGPVWPLVHSKQEWPDWYPTKEILERHPELTAGLKELAGGQGVPGGPNSPLGARALYLWQGNKDTLYRIHGTNEPWKIGSNVSSGCIRMINDDVIDLLRSCGDQHQGGGRAGIERRLIAIGQRSVSD